MHKVFSIVCGSIAAGSAVTFALFGNHPASQSAALIAIAFFMQRLATHAGAAGGDA